jgi:hypothetical protein
MGEPKWINGNRLRGVSMFVAASMVENECDAVRDIPIARWDWLPGGEDEMSWS